MYQKNHKQNSNLHDFSWHSCNNYEAGILVSHPHTLHLYNILKVCVIRGVIYSKVVF
jgi:hypothetical protein